MDRKSAHGFYLGQVVGRRAVLEAEKALLLNPAVRLAEIDAEIAQLDSDLDAALPKHQELEPDGAKSREQLIDKYKPRTALAIEESTVEEDPKADAPIAPSR